MKVHLLRTATAVAFAFALQPALGTDHLSHAGEMERTGNPSLSDGVIRRIDPAGSKVSIAHGEIASLRMPPMTMTFKARNPEVLKGWKAGDKIRFRAAEVRGDLTVVSIESAK